MKKPIDLYAPAEPGGNMRCLKVHGAGLFRLARRDAEIYSVQIVSSGAWGRARLMNAAGRVLWFQPSTFTGSFWLSGESKGGILLEQTGTDINLTVNWREVDGEMV